MPEQKVSHEVKEMACRAERQDCVETDLRKTTTKTSVEGSHEHLASIALNGWSLKQSGLFLDLASWPNGAIDGEGSWLVRWSRHWWSLWSSFMILYGDVRNLQKDKHHCDTPPIWAWVTKLKLLLSKDTWNSAWNLHKYTLRLWKKKSNLVWWTSIPYKCLRVTKHRLSPA